jgi:hypothetical protein
MMYVLNEYLFSLFICAKCPSMKVSRLVVLDSRSVAGNTVNELIVKQTLLLRKNVHLDG